LECLKTTLEPEETKILAVKYSGTQFGKMIWADVDTWAKALLMKINAITGWIIPEENLEILLDQFRKKLVESYGNCNPEEIEYAFRNYGTVVKDWGKQMNLSLIDEVMIPYLARRREVSDHEEIIALNKIPKIEYKEDMSQEAMQDWFNSKIKEIKSGTLKVDFVPLMLYEWMDHNGNITATKEEKYMYLQRAADYRQSQLQEEYEKNSTQANQWRLSNFISQKNRGYFEGEAADAVKSLAKQILLFEMIINS
jgi:hypothetical protein